MRAIKSMLHSDIFSLVELAPCSRLRTRRFIARHPSNVAHNVHDSTSTTIMTLVLTRRSISVDRNSSLFRIL